MCNQHLGRSASASILYPRNSTARYISSSSTQQVHLLPSSIPYFCLLFGRYTHSPHRTTQTATVAYGLLAIAFHTNVAPGLQR
jgi:hypothetical protein